ncbi:MAG: TIGR04282 family arsenosugar biosynthesis glycosyltransferase [Algoriphagus sp.]|nr:TIGR04282 family arsenosugar biosynthesis glycosyltransferase [Algoriphagus sp.]
MEKSALIIFQKNAILGKVKTRISIEVGDEAAMEIYQELVMHTHGVCKNVDAHKFLFFSDFIPDDISEYSQDYQFEVQAGKDLGLRMEDAFDRIFSKGYKKIVILGTDCGELESKILEEAFDLLENQEVVIGPARDGGYYLLGMKKLIGDLFSEIAWSTEKVLFQTMEKLENNSISYELLEILSDVDRIEDWKKLKEKIKVKS